MHHKAALSFADVMKHLRNPYVYSPLAGAGIGAGLGAGIGALGEKKRDKDERDYYQGMTTNALLGSLFGGALGAAAPYISSVARNVEFPVSSVPDDGTAGGTAGGSAGADVPPDSFGQMMRTVATRYLPFTSILGGAGVALPTIHHPFAWFRRNYGLRASDIPNLVSTRSSLTEAQRRLIRAAHESYARLAMSLGLSEGAAYRASAAELLHRIRRPGGLTSSYVHDLRNVATTLGKYQLATPSMIRNVMRQHGIPIPNSSYTIPTLPGFKHIRRGLFGDAANMANIRGNSLSQIVSSGEARAAARPLRRPQFRLRNKMLAGGLGGSGVGFLLDYLLGNISGNRAY